MKTNLKFIFILCLIHVLMIINLVSASDTHLPLFNEFGENAGSIQAEKHFKISSLKDMHILIQADSLLRQLDEILYYFENHGKKDIATVKAGLLSVLGITLLDVKSTAQYIRKILHDDLKNGQKLRLRDPKFIRRHFNIIRWYPFGKNNPKEEIRITKYAVFKIKGLYKRGSLYPHALYGLPHDEKGMSVEESLEKRKKLNRFKYTKQDVLAGIYQNGKAPALAWVTRHGLENALMEGSVCIEFPDGNQKYYNVDRNNGISWNHRIKNPWKQHRYWYFKEVNQPKGYGMNSNSQVAIFPDASIAGDIYNLGLGKIMGIGYEDKKDGKRKLQLGILADTGGAFTPNLHQIDLYTGIFNSQSEFKNKIESIPQYAEVYLLILKK